MSQLRLNKVATPSDPAANKAAVFYSSSLTPVGLAAIDESGNILRLGGFTTKDYRIIKNVSLYNGTTTYTPTSGVSAVEAFGLGGGAAGGGAASGTSGTNTAAGGGGGAGGGAIIFLTANVAGACTVAIGAGGTAGTAGANAGGNGGNTTFTDTSPTLRLQANGGTGGAGQAVVTTIAFGGAGGAGGTASGTPAEGATGTTWQGEDGDYAICLTPTTANATGSLSGRGGSTQIGSGGQGLRASGAGNPGRKYGGGGSGGQDAATTARQGGAGAVGILIITELA